MRRVSIGFAAVVVSSVGSTSVFAQAQSPPPEEPLFGVEEVVVIGTAVTDRTKFDSSVAISTFNAEDIAQQAPASSADLIAAVPGFWVESTSGTTQGNVFARGIIQDGGYRYVGLMEDGIPIYPVFELSFYNPDQFIRVDETIARVEALRGGTAPIFTSGAVGGAIDFVTRSPGEKTEGIVKLGFSDYGSYRGDLSWTAPLNDSWGIALGGYYRVSDGIRDPGYTADEGGQVRVKIAGRFEQAELDVFAKYIDDRSLFAVPIPLQGPASDPEAVNGQDAGSYSIHSEDLARAGLPVSAAQVGLQGSALEDGIHPTLWTIGGRVRMDFTDTIAFSNILRYTDGSVRFDGIFTGAPPVTGTAFAASNGGVAPVYTVASTGEAYAASQLVQNHGHWVVDKEFEAIQDDIRVMFDLGSNNLTVGAYIADYGMKDRWSLGNQLLMDVRSQPRRLLLPGVTDPNAFTSYSTFNLRTDYDAFAYALYVSDEWNVTDALRLDVGLRYDAEDIEGDIGEPTARDLDGNPLTRYDNQTALISTTRSLDEDFDNVSYSIGFNYEITDRHAVFGHYTDSAKLPHFDDVRNGVLTSDNVKNIELGYKTSLKSFAAFLTLFQTEFDNVPFQDILPNGSTIVRRAATRTRGVELEGQLEPGSLFTLGFSMTFQDPEYEKFTGSTIDNTGNTIRRIPKTIGRLTPTLRFLEERLRVYLTYTYVGKRYSNDENTVVLPEYSKLDGGVTFDINDTFSVQLTGDNLTNEVGLTEGNPRTDLGAAGVGAIYMARPLFERSFLVSGTVRF